MNLFRLEELKKIRVQASLMLAIAVLYALCTFTGYRMLDIFGSQEWEREGPRGPGSHGSSHYSGSHHYFHK